MDTITTACVGLVGIVLLYVINENNSKDEILGQFNNVIAYSNKYNLTKTSNICDYNYINSSFGDIFCGIKWQCVEYARRYLILTHNITFQSIDNAYQIFDLPYFTTLKHKKHVNIIKCLNGSKILPHIGSLLIWDKNYKKTGHVAIITSIYSDYITIAEQNYDTHSWNGKPYSRKLKIVGDNALALQSRFNDGYYIKSDNILGWINFT